MWGCPELYSPAQSVIPTVAVMWGRSELLACLGMPEFPLQLHTSSSLAGGGLSLKCFHVLFSFPEDEQLQEVQSRRFALLSHPYFLVLPLKRLRRCKAHLCPTN